MIDPKSKCYSVPDAGELPDPASSHGMMLELIGSEKRVVEFGCASGYMSRWLVAAGCRVTGVEVDSAMAAEARVFCEEVVVADLDARRTLDLLPGSTFDVAVFGDVLEHLRDPWRVLDETRSLLADGGFAVISIPNVAHGNVRLALLRGAFEYQELGLLDNTHLRFFTLKTLHELCTRSGYEIEQIERTKVPLFTPTDMLPKINASDFDPDLISEVTSDPEHDTFQFIVRAVPVTDELRLENLYNSHSTLAVQLDAALAKIEALESELPGLRDRADMQTEQEFILIERSMISERESAESARLRERISASEHEISQAQREIGRLQLALDSEHVKTQEANDALRETVTHFLNHANGELDAVRAEISELDRSIRIVQKSWLWRLKLRLGTLYVRLRNQPVLTRYR